MLNSKLVLLVHFITLVTSSSPAMLVRHYLVDGRKVVI